MKQHLELSVLVELKCRVHNDPKYLPVIKKVCQDEYCEVRDMAEWVLEEIERKGIGESENGQ